MPGIAEKEPLFDRFLPSQGSSLGGRNQQNSLKKEGSYQNVKPGIACLGQQKDWSTVTGRMTSLSTVSEVNLERWRE